MADRLQDNLKNQAAKHSALGMLQNQWEFDKQLIPKALQNIGSLFPHYSRHDHSHSQQILINIERLLGDSVNSLSATDTWLLLEAAYWHDIGMVVPQRDIKDALESAEFKEFLKTIATESSHELALFAQSFDPTDLSKAFGGATSPMDAVEKFRYLMAEWFRRKHAGRAQEIVSDPWGQIGLSSPRTELIPARLFTLLGRVCLMHGSTFEALLEQLPYRETGLANDDCHPRFIACMLRLGDLLDIDDNRFCPVMQRIAGENRPASTKAHEDKHTSIRHFRLDRDRIEITAECVTVDGYVEQWRWLDWLKKEMQQQMAHWQDIAPSREFGLLPTLGKMAVHLSGKQLILTDGERTQFSLDHDHVMKLFKGDNLYKRKDSIREVLQNAVDATLIRIWAQQRDATSNINWQNPTNPEVKKILAASKVTATIERAQNTTATDSNSVTWRFTVTDEGTGISRHDLPHMLRVGGSSRNLKRRLLIDSMPEWMKPSGTFGIGFQSVFLWTDVLTIQTRSSDTDESLLITLHSPTGPKRGLATIEVTDTKFSTTYGSILSFEFDLEKLPDSYSYGFGLGIVQTLINKFDPLLDDELPFFAGEIAEAIDQFSLDAPILVNGSFAGDNAQVKLGLQRTEKNQLAYLQEAIVYFKVDFTADEYRHGSEFKFRGQPVSRDGIPELSFANYTVDIARGNASSWLTFDRNHIQPNARFRLRELVKFALLERLTQAGIPEVDPAEVPWLSACLELLVVEDAQSRARLLELLSKYKNKWKTIPIESSDGDASKTLSSLLITGSLFGHDSDNPEQAWLRRDRRLGKHGGTICFTPRGLVWLISRDWQNQSNKLVEYTLGPSQALVIRLAEKEQSIIFDRKVFVRALEQHSRKSWSRRILVPCHPNGLFKDFADLTLTTNTKGKFEPLFPLAKWNAQILLPYLFSGLRISGGMASVDRLEELVQWVLPNLQTSSSADHIKNLYLELIYFIDNDVMEGNKSWNALLRDDGLKS